MPGRRQATQPNPNVESEDIHREQRAQARERNQELDDSSLRRRVPHPDGPSFTIFEFRLDNGRGGSTGEYISDCFEH